MQSQGYPYFYKVVRPTLGTFLVAIVATRQEVTPWELEVAVAFGSWGL